jgi:hypothetical protein
MPRSSAQLSLRPYINADCPIEAWREEEGQADGDNREIECALAVLLSQAIVARSHGGVGGGAPTSARDSQAEGQFGGR